jgi:hypothetical protein
MLSYAIYERDVHLSVDRSAEVDPYDARVAVSRNFDLLGSQGRVLAESHKPWILVMDPESVVVWNLFMPIESVRTVTPTTVIFVRGVTVAVSSTVESRPGIINAMALSPDNDERTTLLRQSSLSSRPAEVIAEALTRAGEKTK